MNRLFHPTAPPEAHWKHFSARAAAAAYCGLAWPHTAEDDRRAADHFRSIRFTIPLELPPEYPDALTGFERVRQHVLGLCAARVQGKNGPEIPPAVRGAAGDAALAALQLYMAERTGQLVHERREKWEPFHQGYGCIGVYADQAITYEPPPEIDGRRAGGPS